MSKPTLKILHCDYCGADCGTGTRWPGDLISCGKPECNREVSRDEQQRREEMHERLDEDLDYGRF